MTYEEALKIIGKFMPSEKIDTTKKLDALMQAMHALERQIPKKPIIKEFDDIDERTNESYKWKFYLCSACSETIALKSYTHCHCGQAIDWSVKND